MSEATLLESRLSKVERDNRRLKLTVGALLLALAAVPLVGAVMPEQIPELITARQFSVIDENGTARARMADDGIFYYDENSARRAGISELGIIYYDENEVLRAWMANDGINYFGEDETLRAAMRAVGFFSYDENKNVLAVMYSGGTAYYDENETLRAALGRVRNVTPSTGAETTYPAQASLYDAEGNVIWQALGGR
jgi:hypothetical protein